MRTSVVHSSQSDNAALIFQAIPTSDGECSVPRGTPAWWGGNSSPGCQSKLAVNMQWTRVSSEPQIPENLYLLTNNPFCLTVHLGVALWFPLQLCWTQSLKKKSLVYQATDLLLAPLGSAWDRFHWEKSYRKCQQTVCVCARDSQQLWFQIDFIFPSSKEFYTHRETFCCI